MFFLQATDLSLSFGDRIILDKIHLNLSQTTKAALSGSNGSGKSTLLKILAQQIPFDAGNINHSRDLHISYLPQTGIIHHDLSLQEEIEKAFSHIHRWIQEKEALEKQIAQKKAGTQEAKLLQTLLEKHYQIEEKIQASGYYQRQREVDRVLLGLGFDLTDKEKITSTFSGGWQMRIALAKILLEHPQILLLDEPTNYLDMEAREWLAQFLKNYRGSYLLVSHDRYFLDQTINEVYELFQGKLKRYKGSYSEYEKRRQIEMESLIKAYEKQQEEIERNEIFIRRFRSTATKASVVQSRIKMLEKIQPIQIPDNLKKIAFAFPPAPRSGEIALTVESLGKTYGDKIIFQNLSFVIKRGERVGFCGINGAGKTTLLKAIAGIDKNYAGTIKIGSEIAMGYFAQDSSEVLNPELTIEQTIEQVCPTAMIPKIRSLAGAFLFSNDDIFKKISLLSGGEKNRLSLLKLLLQPHNLLILDEPTNHLDIHSKEVLLEALKKFEGTILFVSHDRYFIDQLATRILYLESGTMKDYPGNYDYFLWKQEEFKNLNEKKDCFATKEKKWIDPNPSKNSCLSHQQQKELRNKIRALQNKEEALLESIEKIEKAINELDESLNDPDVYSDSSKASAIVARKEKAIIERENLMIAWEQISQELESIQKESPKKNSQVKEI